MVSLIDETGNKYGKLTVLEKASRKEKKHAYWTCRCECGEIKDVRGKYLRGGRIKSCGCSLQEVKTDGARRLYFVWKSMLYRCRNPKSNNYKNYGARGIGVCSRWEDINNFYADMGDCPEGFQIDRIDNDGDYEPSNCRWISQTDNTRRNSNAKLNTEAVKVIRYMAKYHNTPLTKLAEIYKVSASTIQHVVAGRSWSDVSIKALEDI